MPKPNQKRSNLTARLVQVLEYMDGPQAVLLERSPTYKIVAVAIDKTGYSHPFFGSGISLEQWERYRRGLLDLRSLFMLPRWKEWFIFDLNYHDYGEIRLLRARKDEFSEEHYIPDPGFFAYDHSEPIKSNEAESLSTQKYKTDGVWDLPDFTEFYHKVTDLYVFFLSLSKYKAGNTSTERKRAIREAFTGPPLRGGSSYVNLYAGLLSAQTLDERLSVGKLKYASPGEVDVRGRFDVFTEMEVSLVEFASRYESIKQAYQSIYSFLHKNKLLKVDLDHFDNSGPISNFILRESFQFARELQLSDAELVYELTGNNSLKFSKILLAHFRRLESYFIFFAEGRVKSQEIVS